MSGVDCFFLPFAAASSVADLVNRRKLLPANDFAATPPLRALTTPLAANSSRGAAFKSRDTYSTHIRAPPNEDFTPIKNAKVRISFATLYHHISLYFALHNIAYAIAHPVPLPYPPIKITGRHKSTRKSTDRHTRFVRPRTAPRVDPRGTWPAFFVKPTKFNIWSAVMRSFDSLSRGWSQNKKFSKKLPLKEA